MRRVLLAACMAAAVPCRAGVQIPNLDLGAAFSLLQRAVKSADLSELEARHARSDPSPFRMSVGDPWTEETRLRVYRSGPPDVLDKAFGLLAPLALDSPVPVLPLIKPVLDPFPDAAALAIAERCRGAHRGWWARVGCVSAEVHSFFQGHKFEGTRTFCRSHAKAFDESFAVLGLERSWSKYLDGSTREEHVVNAVIVTDGRGVAFAYAMDSGWFPGTLFPQNEAAIRRHDRDGDGKTDFFELPAIGAEPTYFFRPR